MTPMTMTPPLRRALSGLGILALLVAGCVPAPSVTTLRTAPAATSSSLAVQGLLKAEIERAALEPSPYHEVVLSGDFQPFVIAPLSERARLAEHRLYGLIPDPEDPDRFTRTDDPDAPGVTHLSYYPDEETTNFSPALVAERGGIAAARIGYLRSETMRLAFPQATSGPLTVRSSSPAMGIITGGEEETFVHRRLTFAEDLLTPLEGAKDAVVVFTVQNLDGEPINGLTKDHIWFSLYNPNSSWGWGYIPFVKLEAIAEGKYRIREPYSPSMESGTIRFEVDVVNPGLPIKGTYYRH